MSEQRFHQAKGNLAFSQSLVDHFKQPQQDMSQPQMNQGQPMGQQPTDTSTTPPQTPQEASQQPDIAQVVKDTMEPYLKKIEEIVASKKPQDVSLSIDGTMTPAEPKP